MMLARRKFLVGLGAVMAAPAIVSVSNIMPVKSMPVEFEQFDAVYLRWDKDVSLSDVVSTTLKNRPQMVLDNLKEGNAFFKFSAWDRAEDERMFGDLRSDIMQAWGSA